MTLAARIAPVLAAFATRADARVCATREGAVFNCDILARRFAAVVRRRARRDPAVAGLRASVVRLEGAIGHYPEAHPRYHAAARRCGRSVVAHYMARVEDPATGEAVLVDWTFRQFAPDAPHPLVVDSPEPPRWDTPVTPAPRVALPGAGVRAPARAWAMTGTLFEADRDLMLWAIRLYRRGPDRRRARAPRGWVPTSNAYTARTA